jgi:hypothetical protein
MQVVAIYTGLYKLEIFEIGQRVLSQGLIHTISEAPVLQVIARIFSPGKYLPAGRQFHRGHQVGG